MPTVAEIAATALGAVQSAIPDAVQSGELLERVRGAWDAVNAEFPVSLVSRGTGRVVVETQRPVQSIFPDHIAGPGEMLVFLEGFGDVPKDGWVLRINSIDREVIRAQDILLSGATSYAVVQ